MKTLGKVLALLLIIGGFSACQENNITPPNPKPTPAQVIPLDISANSNGFDFLDKMQGHWVGINSVIGINYDWFAFDYRAISPSHIHGIYEGGTAGNLLTSFFVTDFKNTRTIMARNGGLLNGIYRSSYFVMDSTSTQSDGSQYYRLVDCYRGTDVMYMELRFLGDSLFFNSYTSNLGLRDMPNRHMTFKAKKRNIDLAQTAATAVNFPQNVVAKDFSSGFNESNFYVHAGQTDPKSASFLNQGNSDILTLAAGSGDPYVISDYPHLGYLQVDITRNPSISGKMAFVYLSKTSLTDQSGYLVGNFDDVLSFPTVIGTQDQFTFTYLHPGTYYVTVIADVNGDEAPGIGDITHVSQSITIAPEGQHQITINNITIQN